MPALPNPAILTADGDYDITLPTITPGKAYIMTISGVWGGGTATLKTRRPARNEFIAVKDGAFTANAEIPIRPNSDTLRISLTGSTAPNLEVTLVPYVG